MSIAFPLQAPSLAIYSSQTRAIRPKASGQPKQQDAVPQPAPADSDEVRRVTPFRTSSAPRVRSGPPPWTATEARGSDLADVFRRVVLRRWAMFAMLLVVGGSGGYLVHGAPQASFTASTRLALTSGSSIGSTESSSMADAARAIVTSQSHVTAATAAAGLDRNPALEQKSITVQALGNSGVFELRVRDQSAFAASALANSLAAELIRTGLPGSRFGTGTEEQLSDLDARIQGFDRQIAGLDSQLDRIQADSKSSSGLTNVLTNQRSSLVEEKISLQSQSAQIQTAAGIDPGQRDALLRQLDKNLATVNGQIAQIDGRLNAFQSSADGIDPSTTASILSNRRTNLVEERLAAQSQRTSLQQDRHLLAILDPAATPSHPDTPRTVPDVLLGAIAGLIVATLLASVMEMLSPVVDGDSVARSLGSPVLGQVRGQDWKSQLWSAGGIGPNLLLAAAGASTKRVELVALDGKLDLAPLAESLQERGYGGTALASRGWEIRQYSASEAVRLAGSEDTTGIVAVVPNRVAAGSQDALKNLLQISGWPLVGIIRCHRELLAGTQQTQTKERPMAIAESIR